MDSAYAGVALRQAYTIVLWGFAGWAFVFVLFAPWAKAAALKAPRRYPIYLFHILFAVSLGNIYFWLPLALRLDGLLSFQPTLLADIFWWGLLACYLIILPLCLELIAARLLRLSARSAPLEWSEPRRKMILLTLALNAVAFLIGIAFGAVRCAVGFS
jgi:hypothetical protein